MIHSFVQVYNFGGIKNPYAVDSGMRVLHDAQEMVSGGLVYLECEEENRKTYPVRVQGIRSQVFTDRQAELYSADEVF